ncbi:MAG: iron-containing alcohol dehydrogenase, partial [Pseudomonadota bacterium]
MNPFVFNTSKSIRFGVGALTEIGTLARTEIGRKVMLVTDTGIVASGIADRAMALLKKADIKVNLYSEVIPDPPEAVILEATQIARDNGVEGIIGLGGGSSLDVAKLVALLSAGTETLKDIYGVGNAKGPRLPLILVPTTAGTGSEVTPVSIVTTGEKEKMGVVSPVILPDVALLDPELTLGLPPDITAATGIDAMVHAIEAYASVSPNNNPMSQMLARNALALISRSLLTAVESGDVLTARSQMLLGSM